MQCCTCSKWVHLKCSLLSFSRFRTLGSSHFWSCPPCSVPAFSGDSTPTSTVTSSSDSSCWYISTAQSGPSGPLCQCTTPTPPSSSNLLSFFCPLRISSLSTLTTASCSWLFLFTSCFLFSSQTTSGFFNGMLGVSKLGALNFYTFFCLIPMTLFASRNLTLTYLPLSGSLDSRLFNVIASTPSLIFFLLLSHTLVTASSFLSGKTYPPLSFLFLLILCLIPDPIM